MENRSFTRLEMLLQIIADELYVARVDREFEGASREPRQGPTGAELWDKEGRNYMIEGIERMRERVEKAA